MPKYTISYNEDDKQKLFLASASTITLGEDPSVSVIIKGTEYLLPVNSGSDITAAQSSTVTGKAVFEYVKQATGTIGANAITASDIVMDAAGYTYDTLPETIEGSIIPHPVITTVVVKEVMTKMHDDIAQRINALFADAADWSPAIDTIGGLTVNSSGKIKIKCGAGIVLDNNNAVSVSVDAVSVKIIDNKLTVTRASEGTAGIVSIIGKDGESSTASVYSSNAVDSMISDSMPAGVILPYAGLEAPAGYEICDGRTISRSSTSKKFRELISGRFGNGNVASDIGTLKLPDLRGMFIRGWDNRSVNSAIDKYHLQEGTGVVSVQQREFGSTQLAAAPNINGWFISRIEDAPYCGGGFGLSGTYEKFEGLGGGGNRTNGTFAFDASKCHWSYASGMGEVRPHNVALNYIIKVR